MNVLRREKEWGCVVRNQRSAPAGAGAEIAAEFENKNQVFLFVLRSQPVTIAGRAPPGASFFWGMYSHLIEA